ncbi:MAG: T9SS C-terminal target domain-containing protein, partial [Chitinophagia bacterium]|nr:T9SS C-terminal target domain-containing protein [Chitinophagia bacterium]
VWSTSSASTATITTTGDVTGIRAGDVYAFYTVTNACGVSSVSALVTVNTSYVSPIMGARSLCLPDSVLLTDSTLGGTWSTSDASVATINPGGRLRGVGAGSVAVVYTVGNACGVFNRFVTVAVTTTPAAGTISGSSTAVAGAYSSFTSTVSGGTWSVTNTSLATISPAGILTSLSRGIDTVLYTFTNSCGTAVSAFPVNIIGGSGFITGPAAVCIGATGTLTSTVSGGTWSSGTPTIASIVSATGVVRGNTAGVAVISYNVGGYVSTYALQVDASGVGAISALASTCIGSSITCTNTTAGGTWSTLNTSITSISATGVLTGISSGSDSILYTVVNSCGTFIARKVVSVSSGIGAISGSSTVICPGATLTFTSTTAGGTWSLSDTSLARISPITGSSTTVTATNGGVDTLKYTATNSCGTIGVVTRVMTFNYRTTAAPIIGDDTISVGETAAYSDSTIGGTWSHTGTTIASLNATTGTLYGMSPGTDTLKYTYSGSCGIVVIRKAVVVLPIDITITAPSSMCVGSSATATCTATGGTWSISSTSIGSVSPAGLITTATTGTFRITYTVASTYNFVTITSVGATVNTISGGAASVCPGASTTFSNSSAGGVWSNLNPARGTISATGVYTGIASGTDSVIYTLTNACGVFSTRKLITVTSPASVIGSTVISGNGCVGTNMVFRNLSSGTGTWSLSDTSLARIVAVTSPSVTVTCLRGGIDTIIYTVYNSCGVGTSTRRAFTVTALPYVSAISGPSSVVVGASITLTTISSVSTAGVVRGRAAGVDTIKYRLTNICGSATALKVITVTASKPGATEASNLVSNGFRVYPNPSAGSITVELDEMDENAEILIVDARGRVVCQRAERTSKFDIDLSAEASGMYLLRIASGGQIREARIIKE